MTQLLPYLGENVLLGPGLDRPVDSGDPSSSWPPTNQHMCSKLSPPHAVSFQVRQCQVNLRRSYR